MKIETIIHELDKIENAIINQKNLIAIALVSKLKFDINQEILSHSVENQ